MICPNGKTRILGIIGHPVGHSLSPAMQNAALAACGLDYVYVPFDVHPDSLGEAVAGLRALGVSGFNVTIPHKSAIMAYLDGLDVTSETAGAVNTVHNAGGRLIGYNTDGDGFVRSLAEDLLFDPASRIIVVAGAGGAARGAIAALCRAGAARVVIANRSFDRASQLADMLGHHLNGTILSVVSGEDDLRFWMQRADLLVNATSIGMNGDMIEYIHLSDLPGHARVYDMVYTPAVTPLLDQAKRRGLRHVNGVGMLAGQGELAFHLWTGSPPPQGLMRSVLLNICGS